MRLLFQCNTVYQLMITLVLRMRMFTNDECDIIISNIMNDSVCIKEKIEKTGLFKNVFLQKNKDQFVNAINKIFCSKDKRKKLLNIINFDFTKNYDIFFCSNPSFMNLSLFSLLKNKKYPKFYVYEDGLSTYSRHFEDLYVKKSVSFMRFFAQNKYLREISDIFVFKKEYFMWKTCINVNIIPSFLSLTNEEKEIINYVFNYSYESFPKDCKTIFFEEGFWGDGKNINDIEIINKCIIKFGEDGFYVKTHPRNKVNRFIGTQIKTFPSMSIPWELLVLNNLNRIKDMTLVTISSAAMYTTNYLFGIKSLSVSCIKMINNDSFLFKHIPEVEEHIMKQNDNFKYFEDIK